MIDRRSILKLIGGGALGTFLTPMPYKLLYDAAYWTQNWSWIPRLKYGENAYVPTVSKVCQSGSGLLIRTVSGRPVRALGNPNNILSQGAMTALAATQTQLACAPSRIQKPLKRSADNALIEISWEEAMQLFTEKAMEAKSSVAALSGDSTGSSKNLFSALLSKMGSKDFYLMPSEESVAQKAWKEMGGRGRIGYNIKDADYVFSIGANYLENWGPVVYNRQDFSAKRPTNGNKALTLAYAGPAQTNTASCADFYLPCKANSEFVIALGVAHLLIRNGRNSFTIGYGDFADLTSAYTPEKVESLTGVPAQKLIAAVDAMLKAKSPVVIVGGETYGTVGSLPIMAGIACNLLLQKGLLKDNGPLRALPFPPKALDDSMSYEDILMNDFVAYAEAVAADKKEAPKLLLTYEANPVYALPKNSGVEALLAKSGFVVALSSFLDETTKEADLVLPAAMDFERFDDIYTPYGSSFVNYAAGQPAVEPAYEARQATDILFALANNIGKGFEINNGAELIAMTAEKIGADMGDLLDGNSFTLDMTAPMATLHFNVSMLKKGVQDQKQDLAVCVQNVIGFGTPATGIPPFSTKIITNDQLIGTSMVAQVNSATAAKLNVKEGQMLKLSNDYGAVVAKVALYEGVQNDTLLLPLGLGHTAFDGFSQNKGDNVIDLTGMVKEAGTDVAVFAPMYVSAQKI